jgi:ribosomal protein S18 acetylase RimI-like enzyme
MTSSTAPAVPITTPPPATISAAAWVTATVDQAVATLVVAFSSDPVIRWLLPDGRVYLDVFPSLVRTLGPPTVPGATFDRAPDDAAALWLAPGAEPPAEEVAQLLGASLDPSRQDAVGAFFEQLAEHHLDEPHWYLPFIGVDPRAQGRGIGSGLLRVGLTRSDEDGLPVYLEASSPRNRALYERHGFETVAEIRAADSPPLWPMVRPAS